MYIDIKKGKGKGLFSMFFSWIFRLIGKILNKIIVYGLILILIYYIAKKYLII